MEAERNGKEFFGKKVKVIFNDGEKTTIKVGILLNIIEGLIYLQTEAMQEQAIPINRIIRMEKL